MALRNSYQTGEQETEPSKSRPLSLDYTCSGERAWECHLSPVEDQHQRFVVTSTWPDQTRTVSLSSSHLSGQLLRMTACTAEGDRVFHSTLKDGKPPYRLRWNAAFVPKARPFQSMRSGRSLPLLDARKYYLHLNLRVRAPTPCHNPPLAPFSERAQ